MAVSRLHNPLDHSAIQNLAKDNQVIVLGSSFTCIAAITLLSNMLLIPVTYAFSAVVLIIAGASISLLTPVLDVQVPIQKSLTSKEKLQKWFESLRCANKAELLRLKDYTLEGIDGDTEKFAFTRAQILLTTLLNDLLFDELADDTRDLIIQLLREMPNDEASLVN